MPDGNDSTENVIDLKSWRDKNQKLKYPAKPIWVSNTEPKMIVKLNHTDLSVEFNGYDKTLKKIFFKSLSLIEITSLFKSIQDEYAKYQK